MSNVIKLIEYVPIEPKWYIGSDIAEIPTYTLFRVTGGITEVVLAKSIHDEKKFHEEVKNLAEYFNATHVKNGY